MDQTTQEPELTDIILVVHGIGDQQRNATVRSVANRLAASRTLSQGGKAWPVAPQPLGFFHSDVQRLVETRLVDDLSRLSGSSLASIGVAEVFWADIPARVVDEGRTMEETKAWARTVVARAQALFNDARAAEDPTLVKPDFSLAAEVLDEMVETIYVLENICAIAEKAGVFSFDLRRVLEDYLGDVQVVAEFGYYRNDIVGRFHKAMEDVYAAQVQRGNANVRLHVVAHSEGTVVSFLGLLRAMSGHRVIPDSGDGTARIERSAGHPAWLAHVAGYMTIGSPIDKHLLLWPRLWNELEPRLANKLLAGRPIKWRNYYDYGDPVGFKLDTARLWLGQDFERVTAFEFAEEHDHGFARYMMPGKAHNDYWDDSEVFEHFINDVVKPAQPAPRPPKTKKSVYLISPGIPYFLSFGILLTGTYLLYKQVGLFAHPLPEPLEAAEIFRRAGITRTEGVEGVRLFLQVLGVSALIAGSTLLSRLPRVAAGMKWRFIAFLGFLAGCAAYTLLLEKNSRDEIGAPFSALGPNGPTVGVCILGLVTGLFGLIATRRGTGDRRERWFWRGMRPLIACGACGIGLIIAGRVFPDQFGGRTPLDASEQAVVRQFTERGLADLTPDQREAQRRARQQDLDDAFHDARLTRGELDQFFGRTAPDAPPNPEVSNRHLNNLESVAPLLANRPPLWPIALAAAAFLYLWWLATLIFDLAFVWHRYVRFAVANKRLMQWYRRKATIAPFSLVKNPPAPEPPPSRPATSN